MRVRQAALKPEMNGPGLVEAMGCLSHGQVGLARLTGSGRWLRGLLAW